MALTMFRKLEIGFQELRSKGVPMNDKRYELMQRLSDYVYSGDYSTYRYKEIVLQNWTLSNELLAYKIGITQGRLRAIRSQFSNEIEKRVGSDIIDNILKNTESSLLKAEKVLDTVEVDCTVANLFPTEVVKYIKERSNGDIEYELKDCINEVKFLKKHSMFTIKNEIADLDVNKINYLLRVLNYDTGKGLDRARVMDKVAPVDNLL